MCRGSLATLSALLLAYAAAAQEPSAEPDKDLPRYTVELIVFTYAESVSTGGEIFVPEPLPKPYAPPGQARPPVFGDLPSGPLSAPAGGPPTGAGTDASAAPGAGVLPTGPGSELPPAAERADALTEEPEISGFDDDLADIPLRARIRLHRLPPEQYSMNDIYDKLVELDAYQPIMRAAWTQTTPARDASPTIRLRALGDPPPGLHGSVKLYQGRFVHLGVDIALDVESTELVDGGAYDARQSATDRAIAGSGIGSDGSDERARKGAVPEWSDNPFEASGFPARPVRYRIEEVRIIKDGDIRYYDHPRFGVVATLTEVEDEKRESAGDDAAFAGTN